MTRLLVIGAGTAGLRTALTAASSGADVVLVGDGPTAGTCLNTGCIPTKAMLHAADTLRTAQHADEVGIQTTAEVDFGKVMERVRSIIHEGREHSEHALENNENVEYVRGRARFVAEKTVEVNHRRITADNIIIATGGHAWAPPIPGLEDTPYLTNVEAVELEEQPKSMLILGGGYIACEYATFYASLGTKVTILEAAPTILSQLDEDLRAVVKDSLESMGVRIYAGTATTNASYSGKRYTLTLSNAPKQRVSAEALLVATGRRPNTKDFGLDAAGIETDKRGNITVDSQLRTTNKDVYAIGDVNGKSLFAHTAKREGWLALEHCLLGKRVGLDYDSIPWAVFTHPPVAGVGKSEQQLSEDGADYNVLEAPYAKAGKARIIRELEGKVKVLHEGGHILGAFAAGADADNLIHELVAHKHAGGDGVKNLTRMVHVHPTLAEVMEALKPRK